MVAPIRELGPEVDVLGPIPYSMFNASFDPVFPKGTLSYAKSDYFDEISEEAIDMMVAWGDKKPSLAFPTTPRHSPTAMRFSRSRKTAFGVTR